MKMILRHLWMPGFTLALFFGLLLVMSGCQKSSKPTIGVKPESIRYFRDQHADLCFATISGWHNGLLVISTTNVPCTDKVQALIQ